MSTTKKKDGFTAEEKAAMRARARELKDKTDGETAVRAAIAGMAPKDRAHRQADPRARHGRRPGPHAEDLVRDARVCQKDGKVVCYFRDAGKFKERYAMLGFNDSAQARRRLHVAGRLRGDEADRGRRDEDPRAREEGGGLR